MLVVLDSSAWFSTAPMDWTTSLWRSFSRAWRDVAHGAASMNLTALISRWVKCTGACSRMRKKQAIASSDTSPHEFLVIEVNALKCF